MHLIPIRTPLLQAGDSLAEALLAEATLEESDILAVSSKAIATVEGAALDLSTITATDEAKAWAEKLKRQHPDPAFRQAILNETKRLNGTVVSTCPHAMLTELKPAGLTQGSILVANAGLDRSNAAEGYAIGWPTDPLASVRSLRQALQQASGKNIAMLMTDSCCRPRRLGVTAMALVVSGLEPFTSHVGEADLFGRDLRMTHEATADQLATTANHLMGNAAESTPAVIIRGHNVELTDFEGWVPGIEPEEDLFKGVL